MHCAKLKKSMREEGSKYATFAQNHNIWTHCIWFTAVAHFKSQQLFFGTGSRFLGETLTILHHKHDIYRFLKIIYFLIQLTNIWLRLRFDLPPFLSFLTLFNLIFDLTVLSYSSFEPSMHVNCPK